MLNLQQRKTALTLSLFTTLAFGINHSNICANAGETKAATGIKQNKPPARININSTAFGANKTIPKLFTGDGKDISPQLQWTAGPAGTKSYALSVEDPDAPGGTWWHWILINIPASVTQLSEAASRSKNLPAGSFEGKNDFEKLGYNGPMPPKGQNHHYQFKVVALDAKLTLSPGCTKQQYESAIKGHIIGQGYLIGTYSH